ncbi:MAG: acetylornithine transaminase [Acidimicrobiia bacterium]|nr:acetylornithine transaminase [Acidimicrobiia bacterium]
MTTGTSDVIAREADTIMQTYKRIPVVFARGDGTSLYDEDGTHYLDFLGGLAVVGVGHANTRVAAAVAKQMTELVHVSNLYYTKPQVQLAARLTELSGLDRVFFANCGATANETAIKLARRWGQKERGERAYEVISLVDSFHGRTLASLAATGQPAKQATFEPLPSGFRQVTANDLVALEAALSADTAAVMLETVQGEGGVVPMDVDYLHAVRTLCDEQNMLLIFDDVQAGIGRTGAWFSWQNLGVEPDIATLAKALANGLPIGACLASERAAKAFEYGDHATTFGGGPVVCAAALAVLDEIEDRNLLDNVLARSAQLTEGLVALPGVSSVRGRGLLLAAVLEQPRSAEIAGAALREGLVINNVRPDALRFAPPLTVTAEEIDEALARLARAM